MRFSVSLFDELFGARVELELPTDDGQVVKRSVTRRWFQKMLAAGKISRIEQRGEAKRTLGTAGDITRFSRRARDFNQLAATMALGTYVPLSDDMPDLAAAVPEDRFRHWDLFWTVAYTWVVHSRIGTDVWEEERETIAGIVLEGL